MSDGVDDGASVGTGPDDGTLLEVRDLHASYGQSHVLHGIDLDVGDGDVVAVLGANGAGKTTTMRALTGQVRTRGTIRLAGEDVADKGPEALARRGVALVPQGRGTFVNFTVEENLRLGAHVRRDERVRSDIERMYEQFPVLGERQGQRAGQLSGGEQQMLAIARALMLQPRLLLLDEPSLGLAPMITQEVFQAIAALNRDEGTSIVLVEQNANLALDLADVAYVLEAGRIVMRGTPEEVRDDDAVARAYLGISV
jgi:branched-chain amino acid transport system ATP-binding protein